MEETYKEWKIKYIENGIQTRFEATKDDHTLTSTESLRELKKRIDSYKKDEFKRTPVYFQDYSHIHEADITSIAEEDSNGVISEVWLVVSGDNGTKIRRKERVSSFNQRLYTRNEKNKKIFDDVNTLNQSISELQKRINMLEQSLEKFDIQSIKGEKPSSEKKT